MKKLLLSLLLSLGLVMVLGSCFFVEDDGHCQEGQQRCYGDYVEECIYDDWEVTADCWDYCYGGTCDYNRWGDAVCVC